MKIAFLLFTKDPQLRDLFKDSDKALIPKEIRTRYGTGFKFLAYSSDNAAEDFCVNISNENPEHALVLLADHSFRGALNDLGLPLSVLQAGKETMKQEFGRVLTFWIKRLNAVQQIFKKMGNQKALLLPFANFTDQKAKKMWDEIMSHFSEKTFALTDELDKLVGHLKTREFPKQKGGNYQDKYFVDDKKYHFQYGHEVHAQPVTKGNGHTSRCALGSQLRLGLPYDRMRHYNLSLDGNKNLKGKKFVNCHGGDHFAESCDHLNIFPNDFIN